MQSGVLREAASGGRTGGEGIRTLDLVSKTTEKTHISETGGAECGVPTVKTAPADPELARLVEAWPTLPDATRQQILHVIDNTTNHTSDNLLTEDKPNA